MLAGTGRGIRARGKGRPGQWRGTADHTRIRQAGKHACIVSKAIQSSRPERVTTLKQGCVWIGRGQANATPGSSHYAAIGWPQLGWNVGKSGRTTQLTVGQVVALGWAGWIGYRSGSAWFSGQFVVQGYGGNFSADGDSGSSVWTWDATRYPVGLLFAGGGSYTICNPMPWVVSALDVNLYT